MKGDRKNFQHLLSYYYLILNRISNFEIFVNRSSNLFKYKLNPIGRFLLHKIKGS